MAAEPHAPDRRLELWPVAAGLALLYLPSLYDLLRGVWSTDEQMHGPVVLTVALWLLWSRRAAMHAAAQGQSGSRLGWPLLGLALVLYLAGRGADILIFEIGSFILVLAALLLLLGGRAALRAQWFGLFFMLFMVPLPGAFVDSVTMPMKLAVSFVAEQLLFAMGYPISRTGIVLYVGQYHLLVADACAGLHTLFTLEALGLLYLNLVRHASAARNVLLALIIMPISFSANVIRVTVLCLITWHFGDAAGQGFLHKFAGMVLFLSALMLIMGVDGLLRLAVARRRGGPALASYA